MASHLDPQLEDRILHEVKSQGVFDEFRKDSMADVDTKPAYQNLRQRVESTVKKFLSEQQWTPDMNKNQLREKLRRHITESGFLDVGVERIVDQVVNPKIGTVFQPRIEEITYKYLGLPPPVKHEPPPPIMHPLPPLPLTGPPLKIETSSLLPTGLEQVSPDSDKATVKSECHGDDPSVMDMDVDVDDKLGDEDDESPPFEPLVKCVEPNTTIKSENIKNDDEVDLKPQLKTVKLEAISSESAVKVETSNQPDSETQDTSVSANSTDPEIAKNATISFGTEAVLSQDSQLSQVSSDSNISDVTANASHSFMDNSSTHNNTPQTISDQTAAAIELASANISEEAQMPKFSENSSEMFGAKSTPSELHFDIKKDEIKFEGTERKANLLEQEGECNSVPCDGISQRELNNISENIESKEAPHHFGNLTIDTDVERMQPTGVNTPAATPTPTPHESSFGSSLEDTSIQQYKEDGEVESKTESMNVRDAVFSTPIPEQRDKKETSTSRNHGSSSSSSRHKKHSKDKRHSHSSKDKYKDRDRSKNRSHDKDRSSVRDRSSDKSRHREKDKHRDKGSSHKEKDRSKDRSRTHDKSTKSKNDGTERSSSSKRSSSSTARSHDTSSSNKNEKNVTTKHSNSFTSSSSSSSRSESHDAKREKRETEKKHHRSTSSASASEKKDAGKAELPKSEGPTDDHSSEKTNKVRRHKSTDSNDEDEGASGASRKNGGSEREKASQNTTWTNSDKQQSQSKDTKNSAQSPKGRSKSDHDQEKPTAASNMITEDVSTNALATQPHGNKVVILSDMLENPNINFIDLGPSSATYTHTSDMVVKDCQKDTTTTTKSAATAAVQNTQTSSEHTHKVEEEHQLLFFEEVGEQFSNRLRLLDNAMDRCRRVVNNLRFDCATELCDTYETGEEQPNAGAAEGVERPQTTTATLTIDCVVPTAFAAAPEYYNSGERREGSPVGSTYDGVYDLHGKRKRNNAGALVQSKSSPTPSDASVNSKENMALDKNADEVKCVRRIASVNKLSQQRYNSEDLYKPRPILSQRSRRRGMDTII
ncbi:biorientation of chromosomes in cell division protein 1-like 1 [Zeugodacus cucurbitae]|uniref:biorientation of chromosomes in cell division protein 1-like 1 n=1 Tax=Zeugodacus cucurbitae TaxID=28588 RepID=UPI0023D8F660|nr:biorientation of chromosomes in cell division protein 1-like 1 [Zeugodacus cucurbitae]XP_054087361.1 biorientation of chromosomes in cell division protein 1-like 1 [Zeugodacus cucurbitae]